MLLSQTGLWGEGAALFGVVLLSFVPLSGTVTQAPSSLIFLPKGLALCLVEVALVWGSSTLWGHEEIFAPG